MSILPHGSLLQRLQLRLQFGYLLNRSVLPELAIETAPPQYVVDYAACSIDSAEERDVTLALGSDDGIKAWLNGALLGSNPECRASKPDQDTYPTHLRQGTNLLLLKIHQATGGYNFYCRFLVDEKPVTDLVLTLEG